MDTDLELVETEVTYLESGGEKIAIRYTEGADNDFGDVSPHVVFCGGFHSNMLGTKATAIEAFCRNQWWSCTRFDYRGHGESDGEAKDYTLHHWLEDTLTVLDHINQPVVIVGSSMGAWLATLAAMQRAPNIKGLLCIAAAPDFLQELIHPQLARSELWDLQQGEAIMRNTPYGDPYPLTQALFDSGEALSVLGGAAQGHQKEWPYPVRLIHGTSDTDVPFELSVRLMHTIPHDNVQLTLLHQADHRLSGKRALMCITEHLQYLVYPPHER